MHLKKLQLQGFKTFAERTEILFSEGVTAVVGPNGSGKSNLGDAVLWVLGEQKASAVRGTRAQDVIFAGSDKRRAMGMAEVSLTVDNSDGTLPLEFSEVTITRRAYRSGEGEYFINKAACRLKDIYELFLDTGVGREAYSLVNQSEIDAVLSVNPADRRGLFEEAAGIKKYRVKKREALRKLEATQANLLRICDIIGEIEQRIEPLRVQAEEAARFLAVRDRLRAIESDLLIVDFRFAECELKAATTAREQAEAALQALMEQQKEAEAEAEALNVSLAESEAHLEALRQRQAEAVAQAERAENERALAAQRLESLAAIQQTVAREQDDLASRRASLAQDVAETAEEARAAHEQEAALRPQVEQQQAKVQEIGGQIAELNRKSDRRRQEAAAMARQQAARQADALRASLKVSELEANLPHLQAERDRTVATLHEYREAALAAGAAKATAQQDAGDTEAKLTSAFADRETARKNVQAAQGRVNEAQSESVAVTTRLRTLSDLESAQEGYFAGVRAVFDAVKHGKLSGDYTVVADSFRVPAGYETALETALAANLQDIITATEDEAKAAIAFLHDHRAGRATFLPLNRMRPSRDTLDLGRAGNLNGVCGAVLDIIEFDPRYKPALDVLLGRVFICETLDHALRASTAARGWSRVVTLTGEIVLPSGALTGGRQAERGRANLLGRKTEIAALQADLNRKHQEIDHARRALQDAEAAREQAETSVQAAQSRRAELLGAASELNRRLAAAEADTRRAEIALAQIDQRIATMGDTLRSAQDQNHAAQAALNQGDAQSADADEALTEEATQLAQLTAERETLQSDLTASRIALATLTEKGASLDRALRAAQRDLDQVVESEQRKAAQGHAARAEQEALAARASARDHELAAAQAAREQAGRQVAEQAVARHEWQEKAHTNAAEIRRLSAAHTTAMEAIHKQDLREARLSTQRDQLAGRLLDDYEITAEAALSLPDDPQINDGAPQEVNRLRRELRLLGEVNTGAVAEYDETKTRYEFLGAQKTDLDESRAKLLTAIKDIDESTRGVFLETFGGVSAAFQEVFERLFGGGQVDLKLTDPDDLLETGIDIHVQPPGKKRQNLALLSGGERALTATALLFAFLKVKPSPFCVLDEVDAPLDGANVERFADLLRDFGQRSQFIVITHNPVTMEAAPLWYGVTMQEAGISRVLSMQVPEISESRV